MGKATGFLEFERQLPPRRPVAERLQDFKEFVHRYSLEELNRQSGRCMDCGVPFCHNGCPLGNLIPEFNDAVFRQDWSTAYQLLAATNNFPEFTGRICPAPCESACVLGINQPAIAIEEIEKHIIESAFEQGLVKPRVPILRTGKKVAVVGSGPAGLAAAAELNAMGYQVTVYERDRYPGGLLRYGIPDFKLEKWVVERRIRLLEAEGLAFRGNTEIGVDISIHELLRQHQAVVLACGATIPRDLPVNGREGAGVHFAMEFLKQQNKRINGEGEAIHPIDARGKHVVVIGGGDTGSDCIGTANRQGAASVTQLELLPMPPRERPPSTPWPHFPLLFKVTSSHEEGCSREFAVATKSFIRDDEGKLRALELVSLEWTTGPDGKPAFSEVAGTRRELPCDLALLAMGFLHTQHKGLVSDLELELDLRGNVAATENFKTNIPRVFAAGDMRRGQSLVVWAIAEGRRCAGAVHAELSTMPPVSSRTFPESKKYTTMFTSRHLPS